ncbi:hypothetical protein PAXRUDRAFT_824759 [Paxillus rubicundulus Ve08.2h10]|uniref:Uncharacterized protein n=1 Tax=Paxillus rubicundulus Ve08.2h10 TaxID=930991 RepID=A0A0D0DU05_9AGAM|nr:hypothetical protein PAXRUDRAFT_824759 [Paxillus rubicundulus Ve08.2h10]
MENTVPRTGSVEQGRKYYGSAHVTVHLLIAISSSGLISPLLSLFSEKHHLHRGPFAENRVNRESFIQINPSMSK